MLIVNTSLYTLRNLADTHSTHINRNWYLFIGFQVHLKEHLQSLIILNWFALMQVKMTVWESSEAETDGEKRLALVSVGVFYIRESELKSRSHRVLVKESEKQTQRTRSTGKTPSCLICRPSKTKVQLNELEMVLFTGEHESKHGRAWNRASWRFILDTPALEWKWDLRREKLRIWWDGGGGTSGEPCWLIIDQQKNFASDNTHNLNSHWISGVV